MNVKLLMLSFELLLAATLSAPGQDYQIRTLETAHTLFRSATNETMYAEAAKQYEYLVEEEGLRNGYLFYDAGNSWFMAGDVGRAILNYRRAELFIPDNADLRHNLGTALEMRIDLIPPKEPHPLAVRLLGWHLNTPASLRWRLFAACWLLFWGAAVWMRRTTKKDARIATLATGVLSALLLGSLAVEYALSQKAQPGVITAGEVLARKGDGDMYAPAFLEPLHAGTEFNELENRGDWRHIRLDDGQTCWIPKASAETIVLR
jgi:tetratricopeptide (TPR) repeat protein